MDINEKPITLLVQLCSYFIKTGYMVSTTGSEHTIHF